MEPVLLGVIGGSGLYNMEGLTGIEEVWPDTPFGRTSDAIITGTLNGCRVAFLPRHGRGHRLTPTEVPYKANIYALKQLGVRYLVAVSACGSLREEYAPGHIVIPDQLFDHTKLRSSSFFGGGLVAHVGVADPFSAEMSAILAAAARAVSADSGDIVHEGGSFITIEGPRFSTRAESTLYRQWGMSLIGMTTSPEAFLAREAEIAFAVMAHVTDYDVWHHSEEPVTVEMVIRTLHRNTALAQATIARLAATLDDWAVPMAAHTALADALLTDRSHITPALREQYDVLIGRYL
jgi:5'-methylthioadenosine phosphorylase